MGRGRSGAGPTEQQQKQISRIQSRFAEGASGTYKFGGDGAKISEAPTFKKNPDGSISYRLVGKRTLPYEKSVTIGVGDRPERERTTISTGIITKDGVIKQNKNETTEVAVGRSRQKR